MTRIDPMVGYGECSFHREKTIASWARQRNALEGRIESCENNCNYLVSVLKNLTWTREMYLATDIAAEMDTLRDTFRDCKICQKACIAAVEMLAVRLCFQCLTFDHCFTVSSVQIQKATQEIGSTLCHYVIDRSKQV